MCVTGGDGEVDVPEPDVTSLQLVFTDAETCRPTCSGRSSTSVSPIAADDGTGSAGIEDCDTGNQEIVWSDGVCG